MSRVVLPILVVVALVMRPAAARSAEGAGAPVQPLPAAGQQQDDENPLEPGKRPPSRAPAPATPAATATTTATATATEDGDDDEEEDEGPVQTGKLASWKWGAVLGASAALAVGLVMMQQARSDQALLDAARAPAGTRPTTVYDEHIRDTEQDYVRTRTWAAVSLIGAGVLSAAAVTLFVLDAQGRPRVQARLAPVAGTRVAGLGVEGVF